MRYSFSKGIFKNRNTTYENICKVACDLDYLKCVMQIQ